MVRCLLGREVRHGVVVAAARFGRYPDMMIGTVLKVTPSGAVRIRVDIGSGGFRPGTGDELLIQPGHFVRVDGD
jgi:hypothetical protein